ncbi:MAG: (deoxy)nucleoside triphosphate pyrophosphohydrolase [Bacteroidales bacterium]|nr:(deoxy)nucleoside triphosphate pyrophosphohydrolase [Bacteroidales bacterium]
MIQVTCAVIRNDDEDVLVVQRGENSDHPLKWEFPGGKIERGESAGESVIREVDEELSLDIVICGSLSVVEHDYGYKSVRLIPFICDTLMDLPVLNEHIDYRWVSATDLEKIDFSEADIPVAAEYILRFGKNLDAATSSGSDTGVDISGIKEMLTGRTGFGACDLVAESAVENNSVMRALMGLSLADDTTMAFRSSYCLVKADEKAPGSVAPLYSEMIELMPGLKNESVIRSFLKLINTAGIQGFAQKEHGILADCCFTWLNTGNSAIAVKAYAMESLYNLSVIYPELTGELRASINRNMDDGSAAIKARGRQILAKLLNC